MNRKPKQKYFTEEGILLVDKPKGPTSFGVIRYMRKAFGERKIGHAGTLDPLASGLLILGVSKVGTRKLTEFIKQTKVYEALIVFGKKTSTGDREGETIDSCPLEKAKNIKKEEVEAVLEKLVGTHDLKVPLYSAIKVDGKPLYWYARKGVTPPRIPVKTMTIKGITLLGMYDGFGKPGEEMQDSQEYGIRVRVDVGSGAYIRVISEYIGELLGVPAMMGDLRRISIDKYSVEDAFVLNPEDFEKRVQENPQE